MILLQKVVIKIASIKLRKIADEVRSKNAGPFELTFDILFADEDKYEMVKKSGAISKSSIIATYGISADEILELVWHDKAKGVKITIERPTSSGGPEDRDAFGGQQHVPLLDIEIPVTS